MNRSRGLGLFSAILLATLLAPPPAGAQPEDRVRFNEQDLFLSGGNVAWIDFARDIGPGSTNLNRFDEILRQLHESGGNAMRLWLHTTGASTPEWNGSEVVSPGVGAIEDLEAILDLAWRYEVGLQLCLWSFDMLRISNGTTVTDRAYGLLTDPELTQTYIDNALVPMVEALEGHPGIIAWEIFNEAEGMSNEYGWSFNRHVPMSAIQRFVNRTAGAIHRADPSAQVTNGAWSFHVLWDGTPGKQDAAGTDDDADRAQARADDDAQHTQAGTDDDAQRSRALTDDEVRRARAALSAKYRHEFTEAEVRAHFQKLQTAADQNFYSDEALTAAGGDPDGTLDFYNVHYYEWAGTALSPFHHDVEYWYLDKPLVVGEFFMGVDTQYDANPDASYGVAWQDMYTTLFDRGYAGAMAWQWFNFPTSAEGVVNWPRMLENMETIWDLHREAVDIHPGLRIAYFEAEPPGIEAGQSSELTWAVSGAATITLDGVPVDSVGTLVVTPDATTIYTLIAAGAGGEADTMHATVEVLDPEQVNRAGTRTAVASTEETCCGPTLSAGLATDGDMNTRWSSEWEEGPADDDPDDEWIYVDLGDAYDVQRIVLEWETAFGSAYEIDVSYDAHLWTTVHSETAGDGGTDEIVFDDPPSARYVRMHGIDRATQWGYSLYEFEVYGLHSSRQPPTAGFEAPAEGAVIAPGSVVAVRADASDPDGHVARVELYVDGDLLAAVDIEPYEALWGNFDDGPHSIYAVVVDDDGIAVRSAEHEVYVVSTDGFTRFEAEQANYTGDVTARPNAAATGGRYLDMRDNGTIAFNDVTTPGPGEYLLTFRYNLFYDVPKDQYLVINGDTLTELRFNGPTQVWLERGARVPLRGGSNTVEIHKYWGWMYFDNMSLSLEPLNVSADDFGLLPDAFALEQNYPNPFNPATVISFTLPSTGQVRLAVFDVVGRRVATLVDGVRASGTHTARFDATDLSSGVYFYRLEAGDFVQTRSMLLMR